MAIATTSPNPESEVLQRLLADDLPPERESEAIHQWIRRSPQAADSILNVLLEQKHHHKRAAQELKEMMMEPPCFPATFLRLFHGTPPRVLVAAGNRRSSVRVSPGVRIEDLDCGAPVFLNAAANLLVAAAPGYACPGQVAVYAREHNGRAVLQVPGDEEIVADVAGGLRDSLKKGDLVLFDRDSLVAIEKIAADPTELELLTEIEADVSIRQLGGLNQVFAELVKELSLHLLRPDLVGRFQLNPVKSILLSGPPGTGKTSLVKAVAQHFREDEGVPVRLLLARPGVHRSMWFGVSEQRINSIFEEARHAAETTDGFVFLFFDDCDGLGNREHGAVNAIDARLIPAFLQGIDSVRGINRLLLIGATNREDTLDEAMRRQGRFGDRIFRIGRPDRSATREIFAKLLNLDLPYAAEAEPAQAAAAIADQVVSSLFAPNGEQSVLATLTFRDNSRRPVRASDVLTGALLAGVVEQAKRECCYRSLHNGMCGLTASDVLSALDRALTGVAEGLRVGAGLYQALDLGRDLDVVHIEIHASRKAPRTHEFLRTQ
jgi:ATP-dependent 26S proteasome regulatory subunit